jgi:imidazole glycerol-phosphate synthase subunit HisH
LAARCRLQAASFLIFVLKLEACSLELGARMIVIIDYGMGNLKSVENAAIFLGTQTKITDSVTAIKKATKIIFPGVGHFAKAIKELKARKIFELLKEKIKEGVPFLGICLGMQLLFETSEEANYRGGS